MPNVRAAFAIGGTDSAGCPRNSFRLETEAACESLAAIAGSSLGAIAGADMYAGRDEYSYYPAGCFRHTVTGKFYWNKNESGANNSFAQPLCAGAPASICAVRAAAKRRLSVVHTCLTMWYCITQY